MAIQWSLVLFAALAAWGAGTYLVSIVMSGWLGLAQDTRKPALIVSAVALVVGAIASMTHLGHLDRIFGVLSNPGSGIFIEGLSAGLLVVVIAVYLIAMSRAAKPATLKAIGTVGMAFALVLMVAVGSSYLMVAKPAWDVIALPVLSISTALVMGCLTVFALYAVTGGGADRERTVAGLKKATIIVVAVQAVTVAAYLISVGAAPFQDETRSVARIVGGDLALLFWGAVVALGIAVPFAASLVQGRTRFVQADGESASVGSGGAIALLVTALVGAIIAAIAFRVIMFSIGTSIIAFGF